MKVLFLDNSVYCIEDYFNANKQYKSCLYSLHALIHIGFLIDVLQCHLPPAL
jgi:hypothetical protein